MSPAVYSFCLAPDYAVSLSRCVGWPGGGVHPKPSYECVYRVCTMYILPYVVLFLLLFLSFLRPSVKQIKWLKSNVDFSRMDAKKKNKPDSPLTAHPTQTSFGGGTVFFQFDRPTDLNIWNERFRGPTNYSEVPYLVVQPCSGQPWNYLNR